MKMNKRLDLCGDAVAMIFSISQTEEIFKIISFVISIIATIFSLIYTLYLWLQKAKADGKITKEEIEEAIKEIKTTTSKVKEMVEEYNEEKGEI